MSVGSHGESYGMREMGGGQSMAMMNNVHGVGPGEVFDPYAVAAGGAAGAAGIGVARARSGRVAGDGGYAAALQDGGAPYAAFAAPGSAPPPSNSPSPSRQPQSNMDILEAAGMGNHLAGVGALSRGQSVSQQPGQYNSQYQPYPGSQGQQQLHQRSPSASAEYANLDRSRSMVSSEGQQQQGYQQYDHSPQYGGAAAYGQQPQQAYPQHQAYAAQPQQANVNNRYSVAEDDDDAYGGYVADDAPAAASHTAGAHAISSGGGNGNGGSGEKLPNPFGGEIEKERERDSSAEEDEPRRVLKVANQ
ncbi:hypothetical protein BDN70DRAFT_424974 [Pholiota conissans]|uniref:Uncharacterized protein n=1 Tax=Pholiota conissans TaxID=109636 RepID=A0A9P5YPU3_9AGAR|nr:hypothetical protein BDN70DRAFT_424974 [Pholiota conissans]